MNNYVGSEVLHYKRGMYYVNRLINTFPNGKYIQKNEDDFFEKQFNRFRCNEIACFDLNNFNFICVLSLMGLNKEAIEKNENYKDYKYNINYDIADVKTNLKHFKGSTPLLNYYLENFENVRQYTSSYDEWLSINSLNNLANYEYNYLSKVRNSLMHSEYNFDLFLGYAPLIANIRNTDYTNFSARLFLPKFLEFSKHYFSNDGFFGLMDKLYVVRCKNDIRDFDNVCDDASLLHFLENMMEVNKVNYNNDSKVKNTLEKKLFVDKRITIDRVCRDEELERLNLLPEDIDNIFNMILCSYGEEFYKLDNEIKFRIIFGAVKYRLDPKSVISSWIMHFYSYNTCSIKGLKIEDKFVTTFAMMPSLYILKSYLVLYRLQNKELANWDIDLDLINEIDYQYDINYYNDYKLKLINKGVILDEEQYKKKYFCEIFRDSLAHGNLNVEFKKDDTGKIVQYLCFSDVWKSRVRKVTLSVFELDGFLSSASFDGKDLTDKGKSYTKV